MIENFVQYVGFYGPIIIAIINIVYLWKQQFYLVIYAIFLFLNVYINKGLKLIIQNPRPVDSKERNDFDDIKNYTGAEKYGMPSGHSQSVFFSIVYSYFVLKNMDIFIVSSFIGAITLYQRWKTKKHTLMQLLGGALVGGIIGYSVYFLSKTYKKTFSFSSSVNV
jgi:membrane-associated phospholipid phosphatase